MRSLTSKSSEREEKKLGNLIGVTGGDDPEAEANLGDKTGEEHHDKEGDYTPSARIAQYIQPVRERLTTPELRSASACFTLTFRPSAASCLPKNSESPMPTLAFFLRKPLSSSLILGSLMLLTLLGAPAAHADDYTDVNRLIGAKQFPEALAKADKYLAGKPRDPQMRFLKGVIQGETAKTGDAIETFTQITQDYPELPEPYNNLAVLYAGQSQYDKARATLEMAIRLNPRYATAHENLGDVYARLASQSYSRALQLDAGNAGLRPKLALIGQLLAPAAKAASPAKAP